jgi:hypothetical protein
MARDCRSDRDLAHPSEATSGGAVMSANQQGQSAADRNIVKRLRWFADTSTYLWSDDQGLLREAADMHAALLAERDALWGALVRIAQGGNEVFTDFPHNNPMGREEMALLARATLRSLSSGHRQGEAK